MAIVAAVGVLIWQNTHGETEQTSNQKPSFAFDSDKAPGWWSSGNNWPDIRDYTGDQITEADLPIADINVARGTREVPGDCFVMAFYQKGPVNIPEALETRRTGMIPADKSPDILKQIATPTQTISTPNGVKEYLYYQYDLDLPDVQRGNAFGFIPLDESHIEVRGICPTAEQLPTTQPVLSALRLQP